MTTSKVFKVFEKEVISKNSEYKWTESKIRDPKPSWKDFTDERVAVSQRHLNRVEEYLERKHFCILVGGKDTGKTWLSYAAGYNLVGRGKRVRFATVDENFSAEDAWNEIESIRGGGKVDRYFILEDCHINREESEEFFQKILGEGEENLGFLFTMRKTGKVLLEDMGLVDTFYSEGDKRGCIVSLLPDEMTKGHVKNIIKKFIEVKEIKYEVSGQELEDAANRWGNDLSWVWLRLNSWNYSEGQKLSDITNDQVYDFTWSDRSEVKLSLTNRRNILLPIAAVCQFEPLKVTESFLRGRNIDEETLKELKEEGIILISGKEYEVLSIQESFADIILSCVLRKDPSFKENYRSKQNYSIQIFNDYLTRYPAYSSNAFSALYSARETEKAILAKQILSFLLNDTHTLEVVKENVKDISLGRMDSLLDSVLWTTGDKIIEESRKALEIRACYLEHNYKSILDKLKASSAEAIIRHLRLHSGRIINPENFNAFSISDFKRIINLSTFSSIRRLLFIFHRYYYHTIHSAAKRMTEALPDADVACLVSQENASLYRLSGLIGNVMQVNPSAAERFVEKLSEIDLRELFSREDPIVEEKGLTKVKVINFFLSKRISFAPVHRRRIVNKAISDEVWLHLIRSATSDQGFWLLWNIYVSDTNKAKLLAQNNIGEFLLQKCKDQNVKFYLPLLGLLHICEFNIHDIPLVETNIAKIRQMLMVIKKESRIARLLLSLVALRVKLSAEKFGDVKEVLDEGLINFIQNEPDIQRKEILNNLLKDYIND